MSNMYAYEFAAQLSELGQVMIPPKVARQLPPGASVRVLILVDDVETSVNGDGEQLEPFLPPLEELIAEIKRTPSKPENIRPGDGLLAWRLAHPVTEPDPDFDEATWNQEWDRIEAEMKAESLAHEQEELKDFMP